VCVCASKRAELWYWCRDLVIAEGHEQNEQIGSTKKLKKKFKDVTESIFQHQDRL
jgi:hypothetical protein